MRCAVVLFFIATFLGASEWKYSVGGNGSLKKVLNQNLGRQKLYNCDLLIEKMSLGEDMVYFLTISDEFAGQEASQAFILNENEAIPLYGQIQTSKMKSERGLKKLNLFFYEDLTIEKISYYEVDLINRFFISNVKCSKNGRNL